MPTITDLIKHTHIRIHINTQIRLYILKHMVYGIKRVTEAIDVMITMVLNKEYFEERSLATKPRSTSQ